MSLINYLTRVHFANGVFEEALYAETRILDLKRPMIVVGKNSIDSGLIERLTDAIGTSISACLFHKTSETPDEESCRSAAKLYVENECDGIIAFGSGSVIDAAKAAGLLATHDGSLLSYAVIEGGTSRIRKKLPPTIAIPTTAGTGSEVGGMAFINVDDGRKLGILSPCLIPDVAIYDPSLTIDAGPDLTASAGMDAISHCVETFLSNTYNPPADGIAIDGLKRAYRNIERVIDNGRDVNARREMMAASMNGALAIQKGLGGVHAMSHALGGYSGRLLDHGKLNSILLPHVLEFNAPAVSERYEDIRNAIGVGSGKDISNEFYRLSERVGLPQKLSSLGVDRKAIDRAAAIAENDHTSSTNPRFAGASDYLKIMEVAL